MWRGWQEAFLSTTFPTMAAYKIFKLRYNIQMLVLSLQDLIRITIEGIKFTSEFYSSKVKSKRVVRESNVKQHKIWKPASP